MKRLVVVALMVAGVALPIYAQRGGSRGGVSGHSAPAFRGGYAASAPRRYSGSPGYAGSRSAGLVWSYPRGAASNPGARPPYTGSSRYRRPYVSPYGTGALYGAPGYGATGSYGASGPYIVDYPDGFGYNDPTASQIGASEGYDAQPVYQEPPEPAVIYPPASVRPRPAQGSSDDVGVTLVFKDGRPPLQMHDYVLTRNIIWVWDRHQRIIPTDQLDLAATAKANQDAGVNFQLPEPPR